MHRVSKLNLSDINPHLICKLCNGYFIDPCTAQDCLHSFCKSCIVRHLYNHCTCPICGVVIHKTRPLEMIRHDQTLQDLVYKLVPGVFGKEMQRRRDFYAEHPDPDPNTCGNCEERGEVKDDREILAEDDSISLALVHSPQGDAKPATTSVDGTCDGLPTTYLRCPANFSISGLKKFISSKYDLPPHVLIDVFHSDESLSDDYTLMDVAYIYTWRRRGPLRIFFTIYQFDENQTESTNQKEDSSGPATPTEGLTFKMADNVTITELHPNSVNAKSEGGEDNSELSVPVISQTEDAVTSTRNSANVSATTSSTAAIENATTTSVVAAIAGNTTTGTISGNVKTDSEMNVKLESVPTNTDSQVDNPHSIVENS